MLTPRVYQTLHQLIALAYTHGYTLRHPVNSRHIFRLLRKLKSTYLESLQLITQSMQEAEIYYESNPNIDQETFQDAERLLIKTMIDKHTLGDKGYFVAHQKFAWLQEFIWNPSKDQKHWEKDNCRRDRQGYYI